MKYLLTILVLCGLAFSQDANVVQLAPQDSDYAQKIYQSKVAADKAWDDLKDLVFRNYLQNQSEFSSGFDFSKDFKLVVPHSKVAPQYSSWCNTTWTYPLYMNPMNTWQTTLPGNGYLTVLNNTTIGTFDSFFITH